MLWGLLCHMMIVELNWYAELIVENFSLQQFVYKIPNWILYFLKMGMLNNLSALFLCAAKIFPVVKNQHLLLCTLLIGNSLAMEVCEAFK